MPINTLSSKSNTRESTEFLERVAESQSDLAEFVGSPEMEAYEPNVIAYALAIQLSSLIAKSDMPMPDVERVFFTLIRENIPYLREQRSRNRKARVAETSAPELVA